MDERMKELERLGEATRRTRSEYEAAPAYINYNDGQLCVNTFLEGLRSAADGAEEAYHESLIKHGGWLVAEVRRQDAELARLRDRLAATRAGLEPFARLAADVYPAAKDRTQAALAMPHDALHLGTNAGHYRRAAELLSEPGEGK